MHPNPTREAPPLATPLGRWLRWTVLAVLGVLLFVLGQFDDAVYAGLTWAWQAVGALAGRPDWGAASSTRDISTHPFPVAMSYRLLYYVLNVAALYVLLRGRGIRQIALGYGTVLVVCLLLLLVGHAAQLSWLNQQIHALLTIVCSPLALMLIYGSAALARQPAARAEVRR